MNCTRFFLRCIPCQRADMKPNAPKMNTTTGVCVHYSFRCIFPPTSEKADSRARTRGSNHPSILALHKVCGGFVHCKEMTGRCPLAPRRASKSPPATLPSPTSNPNQIGFCIAPLQQRRHNKVTRSGDKWTRSKYPIHFGDGAF